VREILGTLIIGLLLTSGGNLSAGPLEDGIAAYQRGDFATALRLFQPLAEQGDASAQSNLGVMYEQGRGVAQNYREAMRWFRLAAMQGDASAQSNLGVMYFKGQGIAQDFREAMKWYRLGAGQGNAEAQFNLGVMYEQGRGVPQDLLRAHMWFNLADSPSRATSSRPAVMSYPIQACCGHSPDTCKSSDADHARTLFEAP
jgi:TPR repeat protein